MRILLQGQFKYASRKGKIKFSSVLRLDQDMKTRLFCFSPFFACSFLNNKMKLYKKNVIVKENM